MKTISETDIANWNAPEIPPRVRQAGDLIHPLIGAYKQDPTELMGFPTLLWPQFNQVLGGARAGEVIVLTGDTGVGKTTFAFAWALDLVIQGRTSFLISLEIKQRNFVIKIASMIVGKLFSNFEDSDIAGLPDILNKMPLYYLDAGGQQREDFILKCIHYAGVVLGVRFVVVDHLGYILKNRDPGQLDSEVIERFLQRLSDLAAAANVTIVILVHPAKLGTQGKGMGKDGREIRMDELKGSSSIKQECDAVLSLFQSDSGETILRFAKIRDDNHGASRGTFLRFSFNPKKMKLTETSAYPERGQP